MVTKEQILEYFKEKKFDVTLEQLYIHLKLTPQDLPKLEVFLEELIKEKWIMKSLTMNGIYEYDPSEKLNYGGIK